jgi:hypothetical protein
MIKDLEGEQLSMLAMAMMDKREVDKALEYANKALQVFMDADLLEESEKVRELIVNLKGMQPE